MYTPADLEKAIDKILVLPRGEKRWRATVGLYKTFNMSSTPGLTAKQECDLVAKYCAEKRLENKNAFGASGDKNSELRAMLEMPTGLRMLINIVDPEIGTKENVVKLFRAFPEFRTADKY